MIKKVAIALGAIIVILLGVLLLVNPAKEPASTDGSIGISIPQSGAMIASPVGIEGQVSGTWFFEGVFPIKVLDSDGTVLGQGTAQAIGNWMTTGTIPFSATIAFTTPKYATGTILFMNDNPSGAPQNAKQFSLPIRFK